MYSFLKKPEVVLPTTTAISIAVMFIDSIYIALAVFLISLLLVIIVDKRRAIVLLGSVLPLMAMYTALAWLTQFLVTGKVDAIAGLSNFFRFSSIALISLSMFSSIDVVKLIEFFNRLSPKLGFALALSIKMVRSFSRMWRDIYSIYRINMGRGSYIDRTRVHLVAVKVFVLLAMYVALQNAEAHLTRSKVLKVSS